MTHYELKNRFYEGKKQRYIPTIKSKVYQNYIKAVCEIYIYIFFFIYVFVWLKQLHDKEKNCTFKI